MIVWVGLGMRILTLNRPLEPSICARYAFDHRYDVELIEPESEWWQEIRVLLKYKQVTKPVLDLWAKRLSEISRSTNRVPIDVIKNRMDKWKYDLTVQDIIHYQPKSDDAR